MWEKKSIQEKFTWILKNAYSRNMQKNLHTSLGWVGGGDTHMVKQNNLLAKQNLPHPHHFSNGPSLIILLNQLKHETKLNHYELFTHFATLWAGNTQWDNGTILKDNPRIEMGIGIGVEQLWNYNRIFYLLYNSVLEFTSYLPDGFPVSEQQLPVSPNKPYHQDSELLPKQPAKKNTDV